MIGKVKGILTETDGKSGLIETSGGVYYSVFIPPALVQKINEEVELYTYLQVRDDALVLFGFETKKHHMFFELLLSVSGVGPKTAYSIISYASPDSIKSAVTQNDVKFFSNVPGLGKKTAMKIILELSQKLDGEFDLEKMTISKPDTLVVDALVSLGFKRQEAAEVLEKIPDTLSVEDKIKEAIRLATGQNRK